jgi:ribosomal protein S18 acetylase RimI-like enzyme
MNDHLKNINKAVPLKKEQVSTAAALLAKAFHNDPVNCYVFPEEIERNRRNPSVFTAFIKYTLRVGEVWTTDEPLKGVSLWFSPGSDENNPEYLKESGLDNLPLLMGEEAAERYKQYERSMETLRQQAVPDPHWYLPIIGVDAKWQGFGIGGALLKPVLERADRNRVYCYLETGQPKNISFYQRHGFVIVVEDFIQKCGLRFWTFKRAPLSIA